MSTTSFGGLDLFLSPSSAFGHPTFKQEVDDLIHYRVATNADNSSSCLNDYILSNHHCKENVPDITTEFRHFLEECDFSSLYQHFFKAAYDQSILTTPKLPPSSSPLPRMTTLPYLQLPNVSPTLRSSSFCPAVFPGQGQAKAVDAGDFASTNCRCRSDSPSVPNVSVATDSPSFYLFESSISRAKLFLRVNDRLSRKIHKRLQYRSQAVHGGADNSKFGSKEAVEIFDFSEAFLSASDALKEPSFSSFECSDGRTSISPCAEKLFNSAASQKSFSVPWNPHPRSISYAKKALYSPVSTPVCESNDENVLAPSLSPAAGKRKRSSDFESSSSSRAVWMTVLPREGACSFTSQCAAASVTNYRRECANVLHPRVDHCNQASNCLQVHDLKSSWSNSSEGATVFDSSARPLVRNDREVNDELRNFNVPSSIPLISRSCPLSLGVFEESCKFDEIFSYVGSAVQQPNSNKTTQKSFFRSSMPHTCSDGFHSGLQSSAGVNSGECSHPLSPFSPISHSNTLSQPQSISQLEASLLPSSLPGGWPSSQSTTTFSRDEVLNQGGLFSADSPCRDVAASVLRPLGATVQSAPRGYTAGVSSSSPSGGLRAEGDSKGWSKGSVPSSSSGGGAGSRSSGAGETLGSGADGGDTPPPPNGGGDNNNSPDSNGGRLPRSSAPNADQPVIIEFAVKNFWKVAKQQNDIESSEIGHCRGFYYRLLIHPKGTTGTDSEASHLSVFLEAVRQPWFPEDWVFPNVRFELTVVNFRDAKQNVTSWAHWSFSNDATSRGWQKMLSHSRLNRISGFMDEEGTVLIRGKAEPPYAALWSRMSKYRPHHLWALMPQQPNNNAGTTPGMFCGTASGSPNHVERPNNISSPWRESQSVLQICDHVVPSIKMALHADYVACFVLILYHLREFRREIFLWNTSLNPCNLANPSTPSKSVTDHEIKGISTGISDNESKNTRCSASSPPFEPSDFVVEALQSTFAEMQLWPLVATASQLSVDTTAPSTNSRYEVPDSLEWLRHQLASVAPCPRSNFDDLWNPLAASSDGLLPGPLGSRIFQPAVKSVMKALCMYDVQKMDVADPLPRIHTDLFNMIHRECQIAYVSHVYKQALLDAKKQHISQLSEPVSFIDISRTHFIVDDRLEDTCDAQELDHALRVLFSTVACGSPREPLSGGDYSTSFLRAKHVHSMYRALEQSGRKLKRFPEVLFVYLSPQRNTKKGELFDVPLRLEVSNLLDIEACTAADIVHRSADEVEEKKAEAKVENIIKDEALFKKGREKQKRRLRKKQARSRPRRGAGNLIGGDDDLDNDGTNETNDDTDTQISRRSSATRGIGGEDVVAQSPPRQDKWYSLYAVIVREGDGAGNGGGSQTMHTLLLRPEEDGPWFRVAHNRVEKLQPKVDFSEWKCHRDFFCAAAVYVAEDYIDAIANGDVDLEGDLRDLNPELYERTLVQLNANEEQVFRRLKAGYELATVSSPPEKTPRQPSEVYPSFKSRVGADSASYPLSRSKSPYAQRLTWKYPEEKTLPLSREDRVAWAEHKLQPKFAAASKQSVHTEAIAAAESQWALLDISDADVEGIRFTEGGASGSNRRTGRHIDSFGHIHPGTLFWSTLFSPLRICGGALASYRDCLVLHHHFYQHLLTDCLQTGDRIETKKALLEMLADRLALACCNPASSEKLKMVNLYDSSNNQVVKTLTRQFESVPLKNDDSAAARSQQMQLSYIRSLSVPAVLPSKYESPGNHAEDSFLSRMNEQSATSTTNINEVIGSGQPMHVAICDNALRRRALSEDCLTKSAGERLSRHIVSLIRDPLKDAIGNLTRLLFDIQKDVNIYCLAHRNSYEGATVQCNHEEGEDDKSVPFLRDMGPGSAKLDAFVDRWLERIWSTSSKLFTQAQRAINAIDESAHDNKFDTLTLNVYEDNFATNVLRVRGANMEVQQRSKAALSRFRTSNPYIELEGTCDNGACSINLKSSEGALHAHQQGQNCALSPCINSDLSCLSLPLDTVSLSIPRLGVADVVCSAVAAVIEARSAAEWILLSAGTDLTPNRNLGFASKIDNVDDVCCGLPSAFAKTKATPLDSEGFDSVSSTEALRLLQAENVSCRLKANCILENARGVAKPPLAKTSVRLTGPSQGKRRRSESGGNVGSLATVNRREATDPLNDNKKTGSVLGEMASLSHVTQAYKSLGGISINEKDKSSDRVGSLESTQRTLKQVLQYLAVDQEFACFIDPQDFIPPSEAEEFHQACIASFGTAGDPSASLLPFMLGQTATGVSDATTLRNLRSLDNMLGSVGVSSGLHQLVGSPRLVQISISVETDLVGLEGFACEQEPGIRRVLTARSGMSVAIFYGLIRLFIHRACHKKLDNCPAVDPLALLDPACPLSSKSFTEQRVSPPGLKQGSRKHGAESATGSKGAKQRLEAPWKGTPMDSFMLYALLPDPDPTRKGRHRYVYMQPNESIELYCDAKRKLTDPEAPDVIVLIMPCPVDAVPLPLVVANKKAVSNRNLPSLRTAAATSGARFPKQDDSLYPLLIFKWFDHVSLDLVCMGAQVCDSHKRLEDYIVDWLLPLVRHYKFLPPLVLDSMVGSTSSRDDISNYVVVEECHIRACQNVRRFNAAIKKINKRAGDVIIVQLKKDTASATTTIERLGTEVLRKLSQNTSLQAVTSTLGGSGNQNSGEGESAFSLKDTDAVLLAAAALATADNSPNSGTKDKGDSVQGTSTPKNIEFDDTFAKCVMMMPDKKQTEATLFSNKFEGEDLSTATIEGSGGIVDERILEAKPSKATQPKKKKKQTVVKTSIPANTKSKIKAQVQEERRREADRIQQEALAKAEFEAAVATELAKGSILQSGTAEAIQSKSVADVSSRVAAKSKAGGKPKAILTAESGSLVKVAAEALPIALTITSEIRKTRFQEASHRHETAAEVREPVDASSKAPSSKIGDPMANQTKRKKEAFLTAHVSNIDTRPRKLNVKSTIKSDTNRDVLQEARLDCSTTSAALTSVLDVRERKEGFGSSGSLQDPKIEFKSKFSRRVRSSSPKKNGVVTPSSSRSIPVAAEAVLGTFPDGLALAMRKHLRFELDNSPNADGSNESNVGSLESLRVVLDAKSSVACFVAEVIDASLQAIESVSISIRLSGYHSYKGIPSGGLPRKLADASLADSRVSLVASSVSYHVERLFNDYLRDDRQNQHGIVKEFRKQLDAIITAPVSLLDFQQPGGDKISSVNNKARTRSWKSPELITSQGRKGEISYEFDDDEALDCEADLFERSISARQLSALELFAATFLSSDLIGTRKGLHSLTMCLLGDNLASVGATCGGARRSGIGLKGLQQSLAADASTTNSAIQQCSALCCLCYLYYILGSKQVVKLADSQAGRRFFDSMMKKLSDWLRRLSMVAFTEIDASLVSFASHRQQLLLRHSYWSLVLVLKDIVAGRTPVVATIVSRETEAALSLASLPFPAGVRISSPERLLTPGRVSTREGERPTLGVGSAAAKGKVTSSLKESSRHRSSLAIEGKRKASWAAMAQTFSSLGKNDRHQAEEGSPESDKLELPGGLEELTRIPVTRISVDEDDEDDLEEDLYEEESAELIGDDDDDEYDEDDDELAIPVRHSHGSTKAVQKGPWSSTRAPTKPSIMSIAAAVAASPGWATKEKEKEGDIEGGSAVEKAFSLYSKNEDRVAEMRLFLDRRTGRPRVSKDKPRVVHDSRTWFVTYKPAFWHCSGPSHCVDRPLDLHRLKQGDIERTLRNVSNIELQHSGKMESFHLWLMKQFPNQETIRRWTELECGLCHRIDLETSGAVLIARTRRTRDFLWDQFRRRNVHKEYLLLCHGRIKNRFGVVKTRLLTKDYDSRSRIKSHFTQVVQEGGEDSLTEYHLCRVYRRKKWTSIVKSLLETPPDVGEFVLPPQSASYGAESEDVESEPQPVTSGPSSRTKSVPRSRSESLSSPEADTPASRNLSGVNANSKRMWIDPALSGKLTEEEEFSLCKCRIVTGRTHQIRVHMKHIGHPLVSDTKYLEPKKCQEDRQWCPRMFLHAAVLEFSDPDNPNEFVETVCPLAYELVQALNNALVCVEDYEPITMRQYGLPDVKRDDNDDGNNNNTGGGDKATFLGITDRSDAHKAQLKRKDGSVGSGEVPLSKNQTTAIDDTSLVGSKGAVESESNNESCLNSSTVAAVGPPPSLPLPTQSDNSAETDPTDKTPIAAPLELRSSQGDEADGFTAEGGVLLVSPGSATSSTFGAYSLSASMARSRLLGRNNDSEGPVPSFPTSPDRFSRLSAESTTNNQLDLEREWRVCDAPTIPPVIASSQRRNLSSDSILTRQRVLTDHDLRHENESDILHKQHARLSEASFGEGMEKNPSLKIPNFSSNDKDHDACTTDSLRHKSHQVATGRQNSSALEYLQQSRDKAEMMRSEHGDAYRAWCDVADARFKASYVDENVSLKHVSSHPHDLRREVRCFDYPRLHPPPPGLAPLRLEETHHAGSRRSNNLEFSSWVTRKSEPQYNDSIMDKYLDANARSYVNDCHAKINRDLDLLSSYQDGLRQKTANQDPLLSEFLMSDVSQYRNDEGGNLRGLQQCATKAPLSSSGATCRPSESDHRSLTFPNMNRPHHLSKQFLLSPPSSELEVRGVQYKADPSQLHPALVSVMSNKGSNSTVVANDKMQSLSQKNDDNLQSLASVDDAEDLSDVDSESSHQQRLRKEVLRINPDRLQSHSQKAFPKATSFVSIRENGSVPESVSHRMNSNEYTNTSFLSSVRKDQAQLNPRYEHPSRLVMPLSINSDDLRCRDGSNREILNPMTSICHHITHSTNLPEYVLYDNGSSPDRYIDHRTASMLLKDPANAATSFMNNLSPSQIRPRNLDSFIEDGKHPRRFSLGEGKTHTTTIDQFNYQGAQNVFLAEANSEWTYSQSPSRRVGRRISLPSGVCPFEERRTYPAEMCVKKRGRDTTKALRHLQSNDKGSDNEVRCREGNGWSGAGGLPYSSDYTHLYAFERPYQIDDFQMKEGEGHQFAQDMYLEAAAPVWNDRSRASSPFWSNLGKDREKCSKLLQASLMPPPKQKPPLNPRLPPTLKPPMASSFSNHQTFSVSQYTRNPSGSTWASRLRHLNSENDKTPKFENEGTKGNIKEFVPSVYGAATHLKTDVPISCSHIST